MAVGLGGGERTLLALEVQSIEVEATDQLMNQDKLGSETVGDTLDSVAQDIALGLAEEEAHETILQDKD